MSKDNTKQVVIVDKKLCDKEIMGHNLSYPITQTLMKCLGPYGTILQLEHYFHVKPITIVKCKKDKMKKITLKMMLITFSKMKFVFKGTKESSSWRFSKYFFN